MIAKQINGKEYLFVEVPDRAYDFSLNERRMEVSANIDKNLITNDWFSETLPEGNYTIIGKGDSISEEQWKGIIPGGVYNEKFCGYESYTTGNVYYPTATESGLSIIKSIGMKPETTLIIIKN